ncbi:hypothetical protein DUK53_16960, partial [Listeria sp. SHR_NRA_18]|uniref:hypothetical protein n=1 Tax=Listeria sp. SHR_NRA_18 TaxID=2269046 RepID=UPI000FAABCF3
MSSDLKVGDFIYFGIVMPPKWRVVVAKEFLENQEIVIRYNTCPIYSFGYDAITWFDNLYSLHETYRP